MKRVRWLDAEWSLALRTIASKMKANAFTQNSYDGFIVDRVRDDSIEARYIEKLAYQEKVTDPFGNEEIFDRIVYRQIDFSLFDDYPNIELMDAPRSTQGFVSRLLELSDFKLSITPISVNLIDWVKAFQAKVSKNILIDSLQISELELDQGVSAKVLIKGDKDVREALSHLTKNKRYALDKLQIKVPHDSKIIPIHLAANGTAKLAEDCLNELLPLLRSSLPNSSQALKQ